MWQSISAFERFYTSPVAKFMRQSSWSIQLIALQVVRKVNWEMEAAHLTIKLAIAVKLENHKRGFGTRFYYSFKRRSADELGEFVNRDMIMHLVGKHV